MRQHPRRARTSTSSPRAWGTSDRNGHINNLERLVYQHDWRGSDIVNLRILVNPDELDKPQRQLGTYIVPPDPVSVRNARPEQYAIEEQPVSTRYTTDGNIRGIAGTTRGTTAAYVTERIVAVQGNLSADDLAGIR
jgi:hypothetical protein